MGKFVKGYNSMTNEPLDTFGKTNARCQHLWREREKVKLPSGSFRLRYECEACKMNDYVTVSK